MLKWKMLGGKQGVLWEMCKILEKIMVVSVLKGLHCYYEKQ